MSLALTAAEYTVLIPLLIASITGAAVQIITAIRTLPAIHNELKTGNGKTLGALADLAEGRRVGVDVPEGDRSKAEQHYVDKADADVAIQAADATIEGDQS